MVKPATPANLSSLDFSGRLLMEAALECFVVLVTAPGKKEVTSSADGFPPLSTAISEIYPSLLLTSLGGNSYDVFRG